MIQRYLEALKANLIYVVIGALVTGLAFGQVAGESTRGLLQTAIVPVLFLMIYPMMINIDLNEIRNLRAHVRPVALSLVVNFLITPLLAVLLAGMFFHGNVAYTVGLYFIALIPTSGMTAAWTGLADGDLESALVAMAVNLLAAVAILPVYLSLMIPGSVGFEPTALYRQLAQVVVVPMVAGNGTRRLLLRRYGPEGFRQLKPTFGGLSSVGVMLIVFIAMTMRSKAILVDPVASASVIVPLVVFYTAVLVVGSGLGSVFLGDEQRVALVYATSMRNLSIAVAIVVAAGTLPTGAVLPIALAYILQPPLGVIYMHYRRDVVGEGLSLREAATRLV
jgi:ACR3 family arsenite efflux pump ArsB